MVPVLSTMIRVYTTHFYYVPPAPCKACAAGSPATYSFMRDQNHPYAAYTGEGYTVNEGQIYPSAYGKLRNQKPTYI